MTWLLYPSYFLRFGFYFWNNWINASKFECSFIPSQNLSRAMWTHAQTVGNMMFLGLRLIFMCPTGSSRHHVCSASGVTWRHLWAWSSSSFDKRKFCSKHIYDWCNSSQLLPFTAAKHFYYMYMYMYVHVRLYFHVYNLNFKAVGMSLICWVNSCCCSRVSVTSFYVTTHH